MKRRAFLSSALAATLLARANAQVPDPDDSDTEELLSEIEALGLTERTTIGAVSFDSDTKAVIRQEGVRSEGYLPRLTSADIAAIRANDYWKKSDRPAPSWPKDERAPDYAHLEPLGRPEPAFTLTADVLKTLADRNAFSLAARPVTLFGLRGCRILDVLPGETWSPSVRLEAIRPDHVSSRCVIGLWRRSDDHLRVFRASTVPAVRHVYSALATGGYGASLLPTGLYVYRTGDHLGAYPNRIQRGALRIQSDYAVLRTVRNLTFDPYEETTFWSNGAAHNIHAGGAAERFSCAGCQVIPGGYGGADRMISQGDWARFQRDAGLRRADGSFAPEGSLPAFDYMLLTGEEAALAAAAQPAFLNGYRRLRPGSSGSAVTRLQKRLITRHGSRISGLRDDGRFGLMTSMGVLLESKRTTREYASPIVISG